MYRNDSNQITIYEFVHPFGGGLNANNRWVKMSELVPWSEFEPKYAEKFSKNTGAGAKSFRMALGSLLVQQILKASDEETVEHIVENPYLQFFIGLKEYQDKAPFDASMLTLFRRRIGRRMLADINTEIYRRQVLKRDEQKKKDDDGDKPSNTGASVETNEEKPIANSGTLMMDATCAPADIRFPTDLSLLSEARELMDSLIDEAHKPLVGKIKRPRTYRKQARRHALSILKNRNPSKEKLRNAIRKQLQYLERCVRNYEKLLETSESAQPCEKQQERLETIKKLMKQQREMYDEKKHSVPDRIVSIHQPHVRPIVRGKAAAKVEFGVKLEVSLVSGFTFIDECSWDAKNESGTLIESVENYHKLHGWYPEAVLADKIYRTRENRAYCKNLGIRLSGPALGRPKADDLKEQLRMAREDSAERNAIEGKFGEAKRRYGSSRIMARLKETSESVIGVQFLAMNLKLLLRVHFVRFFLRLISISIGTVSQNRSPEPVSL